MATFLATVKHDDRFISIAGNKTTPERNGSRFHPKANRTSPWTTNNQYDGNHLAAAIDKPLQQKIEDGLDRLMRDIEALQEPERWDGME